MKLKLFEWSAEKIKNDKWWPKNRPPEISELGYNFFLIFEKKIKYIQEKPNRMTQIGEW